MRGDHVPANSSNVQRASPAGELEQAVGTSKASSLPLRLRSAPGRGSSLSARSRLPSTMRRLRVDRRAFNLDARGDVLIADAGVSRILSLCAACLPPFMNCTSSARWLWLNSTR